MSISYRISTIVLFIPLMFYANACLSQQLKTAYQMDTAFINSLKTYDTSTFNRKIDFLFNKIDLSDSISFHQLWQEMELGSIYESVDFDEIIQSVDWNEALQDLDWNALMQGFDWNQMLQNMCIQKDSKYSNASSHKKTADSLLHESSALSLSEMYKCLPSAGPSMEGMDVMCFMKLMQQGKLRPMFQPSLEGICQISECIDFSKMFKQMDWNCVFGAFDMNVIMKNYNFNDLLANIDTLQTKNQKAWLNNQVNDHPILHQLNFDSIWNQVHFTADFIKPGTISKIYENIYSQIFIGDGLEPKAEMNLNRIFRLLASVMTNYHGTSEASKRYIIYQGLILRTINDIRKADYKTILSNTLLQKDILIQAYLDSSFDSLSYNNISIRSIIGQDFEVQNLAGVYQNIGFLQTRLGMYDEAIKNLKIAVYFEEELIAYLNSSQDVDVLLEKVYTQEKRDALMKQFGLSRKQLEVLQLDFIHGNTPKVIENEIQKGRFDAAVEICHALKDLFLIQDSLGGTRPSFVPENKIMDKTYSLKVIKGLYGTIARILELQGKTNSEDYRKFWTAPATLQRFERQQNMVLLYNQISNTYTGMNQFTRGLEYQLKAWELIKKLKNLDYILWITPGIGDFEKDYFNKLPIHVNIISNVAGIYILRKEYKEAKLFLEEAISYMERIIEQEKQSSVNKNNKLDLGRNMFEIYASQAEVYLRLNDRDNAFKQYEKCLQIAQRSNEKAHHLVYNMLLGRYYNYLRQPDKALPLLVNAINYAQSLNHTDALATTYARLAESHRLKNNLSQTHVYCDSSRYWAKKIGMVDVLSKVTTLKAYTFLQENQYEEAETTFDKSISLLEEDIFARFLSHTSKQLSLEGGFSAYAGAISCALQQGKKEKAFEYVQKVKSRTLNDLLAEVPSAISSIPYELKQEKNNLLFELNKKQKFRLSSSGGDDKTIRGQDSLLRQLEIVETKMRTSSSVYSTLVNPSLATVSDIREKINDNQAFIEFFVGDVIYAFVVSKKRYKVFTIPNKGDVLSCLSELSLELDSISAQKRISVLRNKAIHHQFTSVSNRLYELLFNSIMSSDILNGVNELIIAPDYSLYYLPFEMLAPVSLREDAENQPYLGDLFRIHYYQSGAIYVNEKKDPASSESRRDMLVIAKSNFDEYPGLRNLSSLNTNSLQAGFNKTDLLMDKQATSDNLSKKHLSKYDYIYISTHAIIEEIPELSYLALTNSQLSLYNTFNLKLKSKVTVLSACQTARGEFQRGGGVMGFTRGLMHAGSESLVISLWSVEDLATEKLFTRFWENIASGQRPNTALQEAKQYLRKMDKKYENPFYWAGFVLFGKG